LAVVSALPMFHLGQMKNTLRSLYRHLNDSQVDEMANIIVKHGHLSAKKPTLAAVDPIPRFMCPLIKRSSTVPTSASKVRVTDIDITAAVGDSITAGFGALASTIFGIFTEYRGVSWSIGGDTDKRDPYGQTIETLPNIIRRYNPNVEGFSTGTGKQSASNSRLNRAVSGAVARDIPGQVEDLLIKLQAYPNWQTKWKHVTLWIGGNDLCIVCKGDAHVQPQAYANYITSALKTLQDRSPRTIVSLVSAIDVTRLYPLSAGFFCGLLHGYECPCGTSSNAATRAITANMAVEYNKLLRAIPSHPDFNVKDDFVVIYQPIYENTTIPMRPDGSPDDEYFAPDCFHYSGVGQECSSVGLWNNLVEKVNLKRKDWVPQDPIECPKETDFIWSHRNS